MTIQSELVKAFLRPDFYNHPVDQIQLLETHISLVFLTGSFAYKIKKPVSFGFLDFSTLERRKFYCQQELLLNRRLAPEMYLDVLPVTQSHNCAGEKQLSLSDEGEIIDYVVKMQQFNQNDLFDRLLKKHQIDEEHIEHLSQVVADFHEQIDIAGENVPFGSLVELMKPVEENFSILKGIFSSAIYIDTGEEANKELQLLTRIHQQMLQIYQSIQVQLQQRKTEGHIRECHGDLHLGNITFQNHQIILFDGIEFNESFRWIDTISDCAFLLMDLEDHQQTLFSQHFLNAYLQRTGDYSGLFVLNFYKLYRAMVRAKVAGLRLQQQEKNSTAYQQSLSDVRNYLELAGRYGHSYSAHQEQKNNFLAISFGLSGSGKSWVCQRLSDQLNAILIRSDIERKRLFANKSRDLYSDLASDITYTNLLETAELIIKAGYSVIVDATFLAKGQRQKFQEMVHKHQLHFHILSCFAKQKTIEERLRSRVNDINNVSDADIVVMQNQLLNKDSLDINEQKMAIEVDTDKVFDCASIVAQIRL